MFDLKIKPYGECIDEGLSVEDFEDENWDIVYDLFVRLSKKFETFYPSVKITKIEKNKPFIKISLKDEDYSEEELSKYSEILSGNATENLIYFGDHAFVMRSEIIIDEQKPNFLDKFNNMTLDIAPDLANQ